MPVTQRNIDWQIFWIREILFLSLPTLIAVSTVKPGEYIHHGRLAALLAVLLCLTVLNVFWFLRRGRG